MKTPRLFLFIAFLVAVSVKAVLAEPSLFKNEAPSPRGGNAVLDSELEGRIKAVDFPAHLEWLNTDRPLSLDEFRGKLVLLDFWTFCCINCMHVIPELKKLEAKYSQELVVIGVHSGKFENEKNKDPIRQAILRYEITHPVIDDSKFEIWKSFGVQAWPTLILINPNGRIIQRLSGEGVYAPLDGIIARSIKYFDAKAELKHEVLHFALESTKKSSPSLLSFPGKIKADPQTKRLIITDSNHNRILITDLSGHIQGIIGSGKPGIKDGSFVVAEFFHPQGIELDGDTLYIADTENHLIRAADLKTKQVSTILGTAVLAPAFTSSARGTQGAINSPWDLVFIDRKLYIAMAGPHQLWVFDPKTQEAKIFAGSGREGRIDGSLLSAALAQPSGITSDGKKLYFADSETSSIRTADLAPNGKVETLIGKGLFDFGDIDGDYPKARLQHPLGVVYFHGLLYVADTYNSKIKLVDPLKKTSFTYAGTGKHGLVEGPRLKAEFSEPGGLAILEDKMYIADTNNHQIRVIDMKTGEVKVLELTMS